MVETPAQSAPSLTVGMLAQRLDGMDEAIRLLQEIADRQPSPREVELQVHSLKELKQAHFQALRELMEAKFEGNKTALDAALKTQKEASDKIESNFTKQFDNMALNMQTLTKSFDDKISDLKDRFNTREGQTVGSVDTAAAGRALVFSIIAAVAGAGALIFGLIAVFRAGSGTG